MKAFYISLICLFLVMMLPFMLCMFANSKAFSHFNAALMMEESHGSH